MSNLTVESEVTPELLVAVDQDAAARANSWRGRVHARLRQHNQLVSGPLPLEGLALHAPAGQCLPAHLVAVAVAWQAPLLQDACKAMVCIEKDPF